MRNRLWYWGPALAWLCAIALFSTNEFSATNTGGILNYILKALEIKLTGREFQLLHGLVRKSAHFGVYAILSGLFFRAWRGPFHVRNWRWTWAILALAVCLAASSSDEYHQLFTPGRTGLAKDVILDMTGALFMQLLIVITLTNRRELPRT
jgi:VanZ family protein